MTMRRTLSAKVTIVIALFILGTFFIIAPVNAEPTHVSSITDGTDGARLYLPINVYVSGKYAYIASLGSNALEIVDVTNPAAPVHKGSITDGTDGAHLIYAGCVYVLGNYAYVASGGSDALEIVDVTNPATPVHKGSITDGTDGCSSAMATWCLRLR